MIVALVVLGAFVSFLFLSLAVFAERIKKLERQQNDIAACLILDIGGGMTDEEIEVFEAAVRKAGR